MRLPLLLASVAAVGSEPCTIEAKLLAVASRHIDLHIRSVDANGTRRDVWGELTFHCSLLTKNGTEILPELRVTWEDIGLVNVWVRGLVDLLLEQWALPQQELFSLDRLGWSQQGAYMHFIQGDLFAG